MAASSSPVHVMSELASSLSSGLVEFLNASPSPFHAVGLSVPPLVWGGVAVFPGRVLSSSRPGHARSAFHGVGRLSLCCGSAPGRMCCRVLVSLYMCVCVRVHLLVAVTAWGPACRCPFLLPPLSLFHNDMNMPSPCLPVDYSRVPMSVCHSVLGSPGDLDVGVLLLYFCVRE